MLANGAAGPHTGLFKGPYRSEGENPQIPEKKYVCAIWLLGSPGGVQNTPTGWGVGAFADQTSPFLKTYDFCVFLLQVLCFCGFPLRSPTLEFSRCHDFTQFPHAVSIILVYHDVV